MFNISREKSILREATSEWKRGSKKINNFRYADDTTLFAGNEQDLKEILHMVEDVSQEARLTKIKSK